MDPIAVDALAEVAKKSATSLRRCVYGLRRELRVVLLPVLFALRRGEGAELKKIYRSGACSYYESTEIEVQVRAMEFSMHTRRKLLVEITATVKGNWKDYGMTYCRGSLHAVFVSRRGGAVGEFSSIDEFIASKLWHAIERADADAERRVCP
ncbi:hypothetical protein HYV71_02195 [Candidatus Uhrbacteria bacterium]|nr:hypothetical protein [Candidatus Uhrbacteria bacterium]